jgi:DNA mismatch endonuclease, patch repair protein
MTDTRTPEQRRRIMQSVGTKDTGPEMIVRRIAHGLGYRYRLHRRDLPGTPDLVFVSRRKVIMVHGCFWHGHGCTKGRLPKSRQDYWGSKIARNRSRDAVVALRLKDLGWEVLTLWQCETRDLGALADRISAFLGGN